MHTDNDDVRRADAMRAESTYYVRHNRAWVAPVLVLIAVVGLGWWVWSATRDQIGVIPDAAMEVSPPPAFPTERAFQPEVGVNVPPATRAPDEMPPIGNPGVDGGALAQATATTTGFINEYDPLRRTLTLENGDTFLLGANVVGADTVVPGQNVTLTYRMENTQRIVQSITRTGGAIPEQTAPMTPNAAPIAPDAAPLPVNP